MNLSGKVAIVTGSNAVIGYETALDLYKIGEAYIPATFGEFLDDRLSINLWNTSFVGFE